MNKTPQYGIHVNLDDDVFYKLQDLRKELHSTYKDIFTELLLAKFESMNTNKVLDGQLSFDDYLKEQKLSDRVVGFEEK